ncbi:hypothetical protein VKT23_016285 [Stygiomarasmius scandens]|uniref:Uncharacterized protein n=1 Tax=Marasmiellus scandens TaxID=2682957 RepID=A0ABR1IZL6_9AGAR
MKHSSLIYVGLMALASIVGAVESTLQTSLPSTTTSLDTEVEPTTWSTSWFSSSSWISSSSANWTSSWTSSFTTSSTSTWSSSWSSTYTAPRVYRTFDASGNMMLATTYETWQYTFAMSADSTTTSLVQGDSDGDSDDRDGK